MDTSGGYPQTDTSFKSSYITRIGLLVMLFGLSCLLSSRLAAQEEDETASLFDLSLAELITITVASKREEPLDTAPAIVSVLSAEDIRRQGYTSLRDILNRQTNLQIIGSNFFPHNKAVVRGVATSHTDNTVLLQLNGRPIRDATVSSINSDIYSFFPVNAIKKIEIVRGPGSVLHGTNAFSGVINIVTYDGADERDTELALGAGSFGTHILEASGGSAGKSASIFGAINHFGNDGEQIEGITDSFGQVGTYPMGRDGTQGVVRFDYKGLSLNALYSYSHTDNVRSIFAFPATELGLEKKFFDAGYQHHFSKNWNLSANYTFTGLKTHMTTQPPPADNVTGKDENHLVELVLNGSLGNKANLVSGLNYAHGENNGAANFSSDSRSIFGQIDYQAKQWLKLVLGAQYHLPDVAEARLSPRLGLITQFAEYWGIKLLYSSAFHEASPLERFTDLPAVVGDPNLKPETIDTLDFQFSYQRARTSYSVSLFKSKQKDIVTRVTGQPIQIINGGGINYQGIELEGRTRVSEGFSVYGNASYQQSESDEGEKGVTYAPDKMLKIGGDYSTGNNFTLGMFASYFGASALQQNAVRVNPEAKAYTLVSANISVNLGRAFGLEQLTAFDTSLYIDNLLDQDIYFPSTNSNRVNTLPHHAGRGAFIKISGRF
ncbi:Outer membrane receptor for ferrienterochelin and colicins [Alteromonadaceae bacterium Bs31]|nr:Outer membrane receptor for ferrienterochelin and colicins [Alteromonadaceae bacterium Bs31]